MNNLKTRVLMFTALIMGSFGVSAATVTGSEDFTGLAGTLVEVGSPLDLGDFEISVPGPGPSAINTTYGTDSLTVGGFPAPGAGVVRLDFDFAISTISMLVLQSSSPNPINLFAVSDNELETFASTVSTGGAIEGEMLMLDLTGLSHDVTTFLVQDSGYRFVIDDIVYTYENPVPLPATAWLLITGLSMLGVFKRLNKKTA
ncbi:MAG: VPLPA-CTERM sorting domain-containing protein [Pseudomonadota bacterium]